MNAILQTLVDSTSQVCKLLAQLSGAISKYQKAYFLVKTSRCTHKSAFAFEFRNFIALLLPRLALSTLFVWLGSPSEPNINVINLFVL